MDRIDCVVVGAGVVGLAVARALACAGREVLVFEAERQIGSHTSARNSEVIHAGIYYPRGSAKARLCRRGREMLYDYCAVYGVAHRRLGKIIVATELDQIGWLEALDAAARGNGVNDLVPLVSADLRRLESALHGVAGLLSPSTGIIDSHGLMVSLQGELEDHGGQVVLATRLTGADIGAGEIVVAACSGGETVRLRTGLLVNAAGLFAGAVAETITGLPSAYRRKLHFCKGSYFGVTGHVPFSRLIYPVPDRDGLGVHLTLDLAGRARFGPDTEWIEQIDYGINPARSAPFEAAIRRYWPGLAAGILVPDYTGIRPKLFAEGGPATDFAIEGPETHGVAGLVNLFGIESPGLTAALAIAEEVVQIAVQDAQPDISAL